MILNELRVDVNPQTEVRKLSIAKKQMVEISRALSMDARILIMDEPTSSLPTSSSMLEICSRQFFIPALSFFIINSGSVDNSLDAFKILLISSCKTAIAFLLA